MSNYIYARKAVESQVDIEVQVQECRKYAEQHGLEVNEIFIDNGFSGVDNNRPSFTKLLDSAAAGDTIIVSSAGSLTRDKLTLAKLEDQYNLILLDQDVVEE